MASRGFHPEILDAEPLQISGVSLDFDFMLEDNELEEDVDEDDGDHFPFTNFSSSYIMDSTETLRDSRFDTIQGNETTLYPSSINATQDPPSSIPQLALCENRRFISMDTTNFDPPTSIRVRQARHSDASMCSYTTTRTSSSTSAEYSEVQYSEALRSLAESMKRSEESRKYVVKMKRDVLTPEQQAALSLAKTRLESQNHQVQLSFMTALEESRKQLGSFLEHMSQHTL